MNPTALLLVVLGVFVVARSVAKDSNNQTLAERILGKTGSAAAGGPGAGGGAAIAAGAIPAVQGSVTAGDLAAIGRKMGWNPAQLKDWSAVIARESGGNPNATNAQSGAYGIAQMLGSGGHASDLQKYYQYGGNPNTVIGQLTAMANYIKQRYGTPAAAYAHEQSAGWY